MNGFSQFFALLKQLPYADKEELVLTYSDNKTKSLRELYKLYPAAYRKMIADMSAKVAELHPEQTTDKKGNDTEKRRYRSLILRAMQEQGVSVQGTDWTPVNEFVKRYTKSDRTLAKMSLEELKMFLGQVHKLLDWHNKKIEIKARLAIMN